MSIILDTIKKEIIAKKETNVSNRIAWLDFLKILSAFLVVFYHLAYFKLDYGFTSEVSSYIPNLNRIIMSFAACSVPLFFIINGALMFSKHRKIFDVYFKAFKIILLTVIWKIAEFPSWFFVTLAILYLLFPFFQFLWEKKRVLYIAIICVILLFPFVYNYMVLLIRVLDIQVIFGYETEGLSVTGFKTMYSIAYFLGGNCLMQCKRLPKPVLSLLMMVCGWICLITECICYTNLDGVVYDGVNASFPTIGAMLLAVGVYSLVQNIHFNSHVTKVIVWLSDGILPIYVMHQFVKKLTRFIIPCNTLITALICTIVTCLICILIGKIMKRIPVLCALVKI